MKLYAADKLIETETAKPGADRTGLSSVTRYATMQREELRTA